MNAQKQSSQLPESLRSLFWDCEFGELSLSGHCNFIIRRVLDRGDWTAITWLRQAVGDARISAWFLAKNGGGLDPKKLRFWGLILGLPPEKVDQWVREARDSIWHRRTAA